MARVYRRVVSRGGSLIAVDQTSPSGGAGLAEWDDSTPYVAGSIVLDREGIWKAADNSTNSRPISGNVKWTLVGGTPYVDVFLGPEIITTAVVTNQYTIVPAPGVGKCVHPALQWYVRYVPGATPYNAVAGMNLGINNQDVAVDAGVDTTQVDYELFQWIQYVPSGADGTALLFPPNAPINIFIYDINDINSTTPITGGDGAIWVRVPYQIVATPAYFHITGVNQGTKTFTVSGDASALTGVIDVVGSAEAANDGTYTIVSATEGEGSTNIVTVEAILSPDVSGWVKQ